MTQFLKKVVLNSLSGYSSEKDKILADLIAAKVLLFCAVGKDCELWHDVMDEMLVGDGSVVLDFDMMTTSHTSETLDEVVEFARIFFVEDADNDDVQVVEV